MQEVRRVSTTKEKKKSTTILIILAAVLGVALIAAAVYFYTIGESVETETLTETTCACYYIDPEVISECGDPRRGFLFELATVPSDQTCQAPCSTSELSPNLLNSDTEQDLYQICNLQIVQDSRCNEMTIKDSAGKIVTGKVSAEEELTIEAKFDEEYTDHKFIINNQEIEPDIISPNKLTIRKTFSDPDASTLNIFATALDGSASQINSPVCRRLLDLDQEAVSDVSEIQVQTRRGETTTKISRIRIGVGNVQEDANLWLRFSFDQGLSDLLMNDGFTVDPSKGEIIILEQDLYDAENFDTDLSFSQLDGLDGDIEITAEVSEDDEIIGTADGSFNFALIETEQPVEEEVEEEGEIQESRFSVEKSSNSECVERVSPNNIAQFTLNTINQGTVNETISSVKDKLPLGFTYVESSSKINGESVTDDAYVTVNNVGDTQEIIWEQENGWEVNPGESLTIVFQAQADENALTGQNLNEVVVTPSEIPEDPDSLRAEVSIEVAQSCEDEEEITPEPEEEEEIIEEEEEEEEVDEDLVVDPEDPTTPDTGIFDSVIGRMIIGILVIVTGWYIYSKPIGQTLVEKLVESGAYKEAEIISWKIFRPKKYFETKIIKKLQRKKKKD
jgi:uncharacterized repeat protein (TIGR01451 family)